MSYLAYYTDFAARINDTSARTLRFFRELVFGLAHYLAAYNFLRKYRMWKLTVIPGLINSAMFVMAVVMYFKYKDDMFFTVIDWLQQTLKYQETIGHEIGDVMHSQRTNDFIDEWNDSIAEFLSKSALIDILITLCFYKVFRITTIMLNLFYFPYLSRRIKQIIIGKAIPAPSITDYILHWSRSVLIAIVNFISEIAALLLMAGIVGEIMRNFHVASYILIPIFLIWVVCTEGYFMGFQMIDYRNRYTGLSPIKSHFLIFRHNGFAIGNGVGYFLVTLTVVGVFLAPSMSLVAASTGIHELEDAYDTQNAPSSSTSSSDDAAGSSEVSTEPLV